MKKLKEGSIVWVKRRKGSWWPGRIMGLNELGSSVRLKCGSAKPVTLLGRHYSSVDWYNLESDLIKAFRCNEFNDFIKEVECSKVTRFRELVRYARRTDAILHALELEKKEPGKKRKMSDEPGKQVRSAIGIKNTSKSHVAFKNTIPLLFWGYQVPKKDA